MTKATDGHWWAKYEGPAEIVEVKSGFVFRHADSQRHGQHEFKFLQPVDTYETLNIRDVAMQMLEKAASESEWMPPEYCANDWQADCCNYLRYGGTINCDCCSDIRRAENALSHLQPSASIYGDLDFPAPNHYDPNKRGFSPK